MKSESPKGFHNPIGTFRRKVDYNHGKTLNNSGSTHREHSGESRSSRGESGNSGYEGEERRNMVRKRQDREAVSEVEIDDIHEGDRVYSAVNEEENSYAKD